MLKQVAILIAVAVGYGVSYAMGMVETGAISEATLLQYQILLFLSWIYQLY